MNHNPCVLIRVLPERLAADDLWGEVLAPRSRRGLKRHSKEASGVPSAHRRTSSGVAAGVAASAPGIFHAPRTHPEQTFRLNEAAGPPSSTD